MSTKIYLNTYTIQQDWDADPIAALDKIKAMGYEGVEMGIDYDEVLFNAIKNKMAELGLAAVSTAAGLDDLIERNEFYFSRMRDLGMKYIFVPWLPEDCLPGGENYGKTKEKFKYLVAICENEGIVLSYHNHDFEFKKTGGVCKLDILLQDIPGLMLELDVCWCMSGAKPGVLYTSLRS